jgi:ethanolamine utilization protein EutP
MRKIIFIGRSEAGKTTLTQALKGEHITYHKTQYVNHYDVIIDTPGEYAETKTLGGALAVYSYEADVVGLLLSAIEPYSLYPPNVTSICNREVVGIVTKTDHPAADVNQAEEWLHLAGCERVFRVSAYTGDGIPELLEFLREDGDILPWEEAKRRDDEYGRQGATLRGNV